MSTVAVGESSFFLQFPLKQLLICNAYCVFEYRLLKLCLLSKILPTSVLWHCKETETKRLQMDITKEIGRAENKRWKS
jgi:hypothetical protein